ncbi:MAG: prepilin-type N-terminal cleavage/methylation domain-containing protein [Kiritimatiellia bacterium]|nr:prepilin-type N-terminal cleavage/methylation domain-containing protein [Kiritimatiellia bacterium]
MKTIQQAQRDTVGESNHSSHSSFTLLEVMIASALFGLVVAGTFSVYIMCNKIWHSTSISMQTVRESNLALSRLVYGLETNSGLMAASMINVVPIAPAGSWHMTFSNTDDGVKYIDYNSQQSNIIWSNTTMSRVVCKDVSSATATVNNVTVGIELTVWKKDGMFVASNTVNASVKMRNQP